MLLLEFSNLSFSDTGSIWHAAGSLYTAASKRIDLQYGSGHNLAERVVCMKIMVRFVKKVLALAILPLLLASPAFFIEAAAQEAPSVSAQYAAVIHMDSGEVLFEKNGSEQHAMASTTKIMTALLTLEEAGIENREVTITREMVLVEGSSMGLREGDRLTLHDLAVGMLTVSGNDAANSAAIAISGSAETFVKRMNQRAGELGMTNTHFDTPSGLDGETHYSTALDMAKLGAAAMSNPNFAAIAGSRSMQVTFLSPEKTVTYQNHNRLLKLYEGCTGVKTGFTKKAGRCLVSSAEKDGVRLVAVTLNAPDDWNDHAALLDYGFSRMTTLTFDESGFSCRVPVAGQGEITVRGGEEPVTAALPVTQEGAVRRVVMLPRFLYAPVEKGQQVGCVQYILKGETVAELPLLADENVILPERNPSWWERVLAFFGLTG